MSEEQTPRQQAAEAAAIRRRWITLGEVLAVVAVLISAATLWNSYADRTGQEADRAHNEREAEAKAALLTLKATPERGGRALALATIRPEQVIQGQNIAFPTPLDVRAVETAGDPRIEADWFGDRLKKARSAAGMDEQTRGDARLPVAITTHYLVDGKPSTDVAIYDVGYVLDGKLFGGATIHLRGLSLVERTTDEKARARIDALWKARSAGK